MRIDITKMSRWDQEKLFLWFEVRGFSTHIIVKPTKTFLKVIRDE